MNRIARIFVEEMKASARNVPRLYFSPLVGAVRGFQAEWDRIQKENAARWAKNSQEHPTQG